MTPISIRAATASASIVLLLALACSSNPRPSASPTRTTNAPAPSVSTTLSSSATRTPPFRVLEHIGHSFDDASETCVAFWPDGRPSDPNGITGIEALRLAYGSHEILETKRLSDGSEALCRIGNTGSAGCRFDRGTSWIHIVQKADRTKVELPNDVNGYRLHHGEIDAWLWQDPSNSPRHEAIGTTFQESCPAAH